MYVCLVGPTWHFHFILTHMASFSQVYSQRMTCLTYFLCNGRIIDSFQLSSNVHFPNELLTVSFIVGVRMSVFLFMNLNGIGSLWHVVSLVLFINFFDFFNF